MRNATVVRLNSFNFSDYSRQHKQHAEAVVVQAGCGYADEADPDCSDRWLRFVRCSLAEYHDQGIAQRLEVASFTRSSRC